MMTSQAEANRRLDEWLAQLRHDGHTERIGELRKRLEPQMEAIMCSFGPHEFDTMMLFLADALMLVATYDLDIYEAVENAAKRISMKARQI